MTNTALRDELLAMRAEDLRVREELMNSGELGGSYVPRMEEVRVRSANRLEEIIHQRELISFHASLRCAPSSSLPMRSSSIPIQPLTPTYGGR